VTRRILTGNQAVAAGALRAGVRVVTGYPGTPSTGCIEHLLTLDLPGRYVEWSTNEKVAFEVATGAAWAGHRAMCTMKMSGLNVAYDALISIAYSGTNGGLVLYVADDPGVSAGMAEQDSRGFARMAQLPMLEPASPAEAYRLTQTAFELSESVGSPVFVRLTTAVALSHTVVDADEPISPRDIDPILEKDITRYTKAGSAICLGQHRNLIERFERASGWIHEQRLNRIDLEGDPGGLGIFASGPVRACLPEALLQARGALPGRDCASAVERVSAVRAAAPIPFPLEEAEALLGHCGTILVLEELEPYLERDLRVLAQQGGWTGRIVGKLDGTLARTGEYTARDVVRGLREAFAVAELCGSPVRGGERPEAVRLLNDAEEVSARAETIDDSPIRESDSANSTRDGEDIAPAPRPITVCAGCPHRGTYLAIEAAIEKAGHSKDEVMVTGDIGCTILGMNPPFQLLWNEVSMGSSVSLAQGYVHAGLETPVVATIGDSTFFHGGIPGLINAIHHRVPLTLVILDNGWTAMTGMQINPGTNADFQGEGRQSVDLEQVVRGLGPDTVSVVDPYDLQATTEVVTECVRHPDGVHVVLARRECAIQARRRGIVAGRLTVDPEKCVLCKRCIQATGCPALSIRSRESREHGESPEGDSPGRNVIAVDSALCNGCGLCVSFCPTSALRKEADA